MAAASSLARTKILHFRVTPDEHARLREIASSLEIKFFSRALHRFVVHFLALHELLQSKGYLTDEDYLAAGKGVFQYETARPDWTKRQRATRRPARRPRPSGNPSAPQT